VLICGMHCIALFNIPYVHKNNKDLRMYECGNNKFLILILLEFFVNQLIA